MKTLLNFLQIIIIIISINVYAWAQTEPEMVFVKGGTFKMGNNNGDADEKPEHTVTVGSFYISKHEITVKQYKEYCTATGKSMPQKPNEEWYLEHDKAKDWEWKDSNPMTFVTWDDAVSYAKWLSEKTGKKYDLPTEAQWEFAAGGGTLSKQYKFSGSDNITEVAWFDETTYERGPMPVGRLKPNELGIYDMSGNAWEWCKDYYAPYKAGKFKDPIGPTKGIYRVIRGGSWYYVAWMSKITTRDGPYPNRTNYNYGFRLVMNVSE